MFGWLLESHRLGRVGGFEVRVAWSLYVVVGLFFLQYLPYGLFWALPLLALPLFVLAHEWGHARMARFFGVPVFDITLHALGGASRLGGRIPGAAAELLIALAGPLVSFLLAGGGFLASWLLWRAGLVTQGSLFSQAVYLLLHLGAWQNLLLGAFNLLPVFPLDGGRILLALAVLWRGVEFGLRIVRPLSRLGALFFIGLGVYQLATRDAGGIFTALIGVLLLSQGGQELQARRHAEQYAIPGFGNFRQQAPGNAVGGIFSLLDRLWVYRRESRAEKENPNNQFSTRYSSVDFYEDGLRDATVPEKNFIARWWEKRRERRETAKKEAATAERQELDARVDEVLAKVKRDGIANLTPGERALLMRASETYREDEQR